jgi:hypothetical protein
MAGAVTPAPRAIFTLRSSGVIVVHAWRSLSGLRCRSAQSPSRPRPPPPRQGFSLLMLRQCRLPAELHASNLAGTLPSAVLAKIKCRSNSARPPRTVSIISNEDRRSLFDTTACVAAGRSGSAKAGKALQTNSLPSGALCPVLSSLSPR